MKKPDYHSKEAVMAKGGCCTASEQFKEWETNGPSPGQPKLGHFHTYCLCTLVQIN